MLGDQAVKFSPVVSDPICVQQSSIFRRNLHPTRYSFSALFWRRE